MADEIHDIHDIDDTFDLSSPSGLMSRKGFLRLGAGAALGAAGLLLSPPFTAEAVGFTTVKSTPVRNGPCVRSTQVATMPAGTAVNVGSQCAGSRLGSGTYPNNATWNRLTDGRWIHDHYLSTPANAASIALTDGLGGYAKFTSTVPRTTAPILGRGARDAAAWWAETQLGVAAYDGWCLQFCKVAWWASTNNTTVWRSFGTANGAWTWAQSNIPATRRGTSTVPPRGAIVHWAGTSGHAAISAGNGYLVSTWFSGTNRTISWVTVSQVTRALGPSSYRGWWLPA